MDPLSQEKAFKKKLQNFLQELQHFGTLRGFRHFQCYIRSKEELIVSINNTLQGSILSRSGTLSSSVSRKPSLCLSDSLSSSCLPYDKFSLVLSHNTQVGLSGMRDRGVGLPPASPSEQEDTTDVDVTVFLIAGYARYSCPYVWVRSNHERLLKVSSDMKNDRDSPLRLKSTARWKDKDVLVTDVIAELVRLCTYPAPLNPFEVDLKCFQGLSQPDQLLSSAAMVACLQKIVEQTQGSKPYLTKVFEDLHYVTKLHFTSLTGMVKSENIPVLKQNSPQHQQSHLHQQQNQQHNEQHTQQQPRHSRQSRYPRVPIPATVPELQPSGRTPNPISASGILYSQGFDGSFPGGFNRMPAPSIL